MSENVELDCSRLFNVTCIGRAELLDDLFNKIDIASILRRHKPFDLAALLASARLFQ